MAPLSDPTARAAKPRTRDEKLAIVAGAIAQEKASRRPESPGPDYWLVFLSTSWRVMGMAALIAAVPGFLSIGFYAAFASIYGALACFTISALIDLGGEIRDGLKRQ